MKYILIITAIIFVQCCAGKKTQETSAINEDTSSGIAVKDTLDKKNMDQPGDDNTRRTGTIPGKPSSGKARPGNIDLENGHFLVSDPPQCLRNYVKDIMNGEVKNPPQKIFRYQYNGRTVYYVTAPCCDFFSDLLDADCKLIGHPDGGITGRGDGKITDFHAKRSGETLVWEDPRLLR